MFSIMLGTELEPQQQFDTSNKLIKSLKQHNFIPDLVNGRKALPDEETLLLASCNYETNTKWGQEIGFLYGTVCEDVHTGFMLNCNGRNSVFCDPAKPQFLRNSTTNLNELLIQGTRWDSDGLTANDVLEMEHQDMHKEAKCWIKETAQSCSTIAVLVAAVVFAAAYTIPGGSENGTPVFFDSRVFLFFTITDVVALVSSLASVVMFLSILT
ncbi:hypothetical protein AHAS_Ahas20G0045500 [Arachis hypogaea]